MKPIEAVTAADAVLSLFRVGRQLARRVCVCESILATRVTSPSPPLFPISQRGGRTEKKKKKKKDGKKCCVKKAIFHLSFFPPADKFRPSSPESTRRNMPQRQLHRDRKEKATISLPSKNNIVPQSESFYVSATTFPAREHMGNATLTEIRTFTEQSPVQCRY